MAIAVHRRTLSSWPRLQSWLHADYLTIVCDHLVQERCSLVRRWSVFRIELRLDSGQRREAAALGFR
jgi:hypothetical protein